MKNITTTVKGNKLTIEIDLSKTFGPSKSGKTISDREYCDGKYVNLAELLEGNQIVASTVEKIRKGELILLP